MTNDPRRRTTITPSDRLFSPMDDDPRDPNELFVSILSWAGLILGITAIVCLISVGLYHAIR